ncbi:Flavorubredoxin [Desulfacinum hydrothermale DSM 13146]|uniref:Flavorubredoxin n=1 Tax=Desulfacinum hydrothermale DSM 13146 TaxID=1121390 RepID=A0A1W1XA06_9BACT|nr:FprA family A-type flavoprotein [Desulfacinum hydrothermale]SMC20835.1 Flavorubredoxin [Desulfacinum hydrothermale DSM 13146]
MNRALPLTDDTFWVGVNDRETELFEALWPLAYGVSYNAYLIVDERVALIDAVKGHFLTEHLGKIQASLPAGKTVDYLVINHMEPDHTGAIQILRKAFPHLTLVGNKKTLDMLAAFYGVDQDCLEVADGDTLELGRHRLQFHLTPMLHWPETMMTLDTTTGVLFSGDAFGGFGAVEPGLFDDEADRELMEGEMLRYYTNIIARYSQMVQKGIQKVKNLTFRVLAPTHGLVWRKDPQRAISLYDVWSRQEGEPGVTVAYGSMYGNTQRLVEAAVRALVERGVPVAVHDLSRTHASHVVADIWRRQGLLLACPTYNTGLFPAMDDLLRLLENKMLRNKQVGILGSYAWSGGAVKAMRQFVDALHLELVEPVVEAKGAGTAQDLERCWELGVRLAEAVTRND